MNRLLLIAPDTINTFKIIYYSLILRKGKEDKGKKKKRKKRKEKMRMSFICLFFGIGSRPALNFCYPDWPRTCDPLAALASQVLGLQAYTTTPSSF